MGLLMEKLLWTRQSQHQRFIEHFYTLLQDTLYFLALQFVGLRRDPMNIVRLSGTLL